VRCTATLALAAAFAAGQQATSPATILEVDYENLVEYQSDTSDLSKLATVPSSVPAVPPKNFFYALVVGDIVAINGQPAKGTIAAQAWSIGLSPTVNPGNAIADTQRVSLRYQTFEILKPNGTPIGTIVALGPNGGPPPPGAPLAQSGGNLAIVGGTGAFLGARGQYGAAQLPQSIPNRSASIAEDPANRRQNGGGRRRFILHLIPMSKPEVITIGGAPAITHSSDFTLVTASKPATVGETLALYATGLGPTTAGVDPGHPFASSPVAVVNSPVQIRVNGKPAEVLGAVGFPGAVDSYQVNFRWPGDVGMGVATIQLSAAWVAGAPVSITVQ